MTDTISILDAQTYVRDRLSTAALDPVSLEARAYPEETILILRVHPNDKSRAAELANELDNELAQRGFDGFITVRAAEVDTTAPKGALKRGVFDPRALDLANLLSAHSRTSEVQPSLAYIRDAADSLSVTVVRWHHLIFGRRGTGKTALMVEAKRAVAASGALVVWLNLQSLRRVSADQGFLWFAQEVCTAIQAFYASVARSPFVLAEVSQLKETVQGMLAKTEPVADTTLLVPRIQQLLKRALESEGRTMYIFIDELHYLGRDVQPVLLDRIHGAVRDADAWLKIAGIKHLSRWFVASPQLGLQTGQDADHINLDITLENPLAAKVFLEQMLKSYALHVGIQSLRSVFSPEALDRLILASGAVPRDYLTLAAAGIREAQERTKAKTVGVQDINRVAGDAAKVNKLSELEDDAAAAEGASRRIAAALQVITEFCIAKRGCTYFRVDFRDKEQNQAEYSLLQDLVDLRLLHLVDSSLSDRDEAGRRSEVYVLDLSRYSDQRLKKKLRVLDFEQGKLVVKETGTGAARRVAGSPRQKVTLLRRGPLFELTELTASATM